MNISHNFITTKTCPSYEFSVAFGAQGRNQLFISGSQFSRTFVRWCHRAYPTVANGHR